MKQALVGEALALHMMNKEKNCPKCKKYTYRKVTASTFRGTLKAESNQQQIWKCSSCQYERKAA
jgi:transposase-like protein